MNTNTNTTSTGIFHKFRALSELKDEAKGGYIKINFEVPDGVQTIALGMLLFLKIKSLILAENLILIDIPKSFEGNLFQNEFQNLVI